LKECWQSDPKLRPDFDDIVRRINGEIHDEVLMNVEPDIIPLGQQDDAGYLIDLANEGEEQEGNNETAGEDGGGGNDKGSKLLEAAVLSLKMELATTKSEVEVLMNRILEMRSSEKMKAENTAAPANEKGSALASIQLDPPKKGKEGGKAPAAVVDDSTPRAEG
jgi:hypothetical protein